MSTGILQFTKPSYTITEDGVYVGDAVAVSRTGGTSGIASVRVTSKNLSAVAGSDYTRVSVTLTWADGEGGSKLVPLSVVKDAFVEIEEILTLSLGGIKGAKYAPVKTVQVKIIDKIQNLLSAKDLSDDTVIALVSNDHSGLKLKDLKAFIGAITPDPNPNPNPNPTTDPHFNNVVLFLKGLGENNSTAILDSSPVPKTITVSGNARIYKEKSKYDGAIYFDGLNSTFLQINDPSLNLMDKDFTLEMWVYPFKVNPEILGWSQTTEVWNKGSGNGAYANFGSTFSWWMQNGGNHDLEQLITGEWQHHALVREKNEGTTPNYRWYLNGTLKRNFYNPVDLTGQVLNIGTNAYPPPYLAFTQMYLSHLRLTSGVARYKENFNPETDTFLNIN